jgi:hypothetical protein
MVRIKFKQIILSLDSCFGLLLRSSLRDSKEALVCWSVHKLTLPLPCQLIVSRVYSDEISGQYFNVAFK